MIRRFYLLPLMAVTALSLSLGACDDNKEESTTAEQTSETTQAPVPTTLEVLGAQAYATTEGSTTGAVFFRVLNNTGKDDVLVGAKATVGTSAELHVISTDDKGTATMRPVHNIQLPAGTPVVLTPTGMHVMLMGLTAPLKAGDTFDVTLDFGMSEDVTIPVSIVAPVVDPSGGATLDPHAHHSPTNAVETPAAVGTTPAAEPAVPAETPAPATAPIADEPAAE